MCGLVGAAGNLNITHEKMVRSLLIIDSLRGEDSTGVATIGKFTNDVRIAKQVGDPFQLFDHKSWDVAFRQGSKAIIGHNRYATMGGVSRQTAHPFENDSVVGAHNGTLRNKHMLDDASHYKVDSENLYHHIHKRGLHHALGIVDGAYALTWWDKDEQTMNFLRNEERPLFMCRTAVQGKPDGQALFWASEPWMLMAVFNKHNQDRTDIFQTEVDTHYSIFIDDKGGMDKPMAREAPSRYIPPPAPVVYHQPVQNRPVNAPLSQVKTTQLTVVPPALKKEEPAPAISKKLNTLLGEAFDRLYLQKKNVVLELMAEHQSDEGGKYISCFDALSPYKEVRLYPRKDDTEVFDAIGMEIQADISGAVECKTPGKYYYKVSPHSVKILVPIEAEAVTIKGPTGKNLTEEEWKEKYPSCAYCSVPLDFGVGVFSTSMECFCPDCAKNPEVKQFVNF